MIRICVKLSKAKISCWWWRTDGTPPSSLNPSSIRSRELRHEGKKMTVTFVKPPFFCSAELKLSVALIARVSFTSSLFLNCKSSKIILLSLSPEQKRNNNATHLYLKK